METLRFVSTITRKIKRFRHSTFHLQISYSHVILITTSKINEYFSHIILKLICNIPERTLPNLRFP